MKTAYENDDLKLDHNHTCMVGIHGGSSNSGQINHSGIINRGLINTFILPCINHLSKSLFSSEKEENIESIKELDRLLEDQTEEERDKGR